MISASARLKLTISGSGGIFQPEASPAAHIPAPIIKATARTLRNIDPDTTKYFDRVSIVFTVFDLLPTVTMPEVRFRHDGPE